MICCALTHLSCSLVVVTFCSSSLPNPLNCGSQLSAYNVARKEAGDPEANENDPSFMLWKIKVHGELMVQSGRMFAAWPAA